MTWRDRISVHPAADRFPMMSPAELKELTADIAANGQKVGVVLWTPEKAEDVRSRRGPDTLFLLDGRNRLDALERVYSTPEDREDAIEAALSWRGRDDGTATLLYGDEDPDEIVISMNIRRRHLSAEQKRGIIAELLKAKPERSDRATAAIAGVSKNTVAAVREQGEPGGQFDRLSTSAGTAGRSQPAHETPIDEDGQGEGKPKPTDKVVGRDGKSYPAKKETGRVIEFDANKAAATEARAVDRQVSKLIKDWEAASPKAREVFLGIIDSPTFDRTKFGRR